EIVRTADTVAVVLVPGMGDGVQALKAGVLEIADVFVINKADYDGADRLEKELRGMLNLAEHLSWRPEIVPTVATESKGAEELLGAIEKHRAWADKEGKNKERRELFLRQAMSRALSETMLVQALELGDKQGLLSPLYKSLYSRKKAPGTCAAELKD